MQTEQHVTHIHSENTQKDLSEAYIIRKIKLETGTQEKLKGKEKIITI